MSKTSKAQVLEVWKNDLWPNREVIPVISTMKYLGGYDLSLKKTEPDYFCVDDDGQILGVISGLKTEADYYRIRGIYVYKPYRGKGIAQQLFAACEQGAIQKGAKFLWSFPRKSAIESYKKFGFKQTSDWIEEGVESGPNCYVLKEL